MTEDRTIEEMRRILIFLVLISCSFTKAQSCLDNLVRITDSSEAGMNNRFFADLEAYFYDSCRYFYSNNKTSLDIKMDGEHILYRRQVSLEPSHLANGASFALSFTYYKTDKEALEEFKKIVSSSCKSGEGACADLLCFKPAAIVTTTSSLFLCYRNLLLSSNLGDNFADLFINWLHQDKRMKKRKYYLFAPDSRKNSARVEKNF